MPRRRISAGFALSTLALLALGCAPYVDRATTFADQQLSTPFPARHIGGGPLQPGPGERVVVNQVLVVVDASGSVNAYQLFPKEKALVEDFVAAMPSGSYTAGLDAFGGPAETRFPMTGFDRQRLAWKAEQLVHYGGTTPLSHAVVDASKVIKQGSGRAALVIFSDGDPTDENGRRTDTIRVLDAGRALVDSYPGIVCIHTVQVGGDSAGAELLADLSNLTSCGSTRSAGLVRDVESLHAFEHDVFIGQGPMDSDGDGVYDDMDQCPGTPRGARVDARGCWVITGLYFQVDQSVIQGKYYSILDEVVVVLRQNPNVRVRVDGHTDSDGDDAYNQSLSERRAKAVRDYITSKGIDGSRLDVRGFGESRPVRPNDTAANKAMNRRTELTPIS